MEIIKLTKQQIEQVYKEHLVYDFVDNERKPLTMILKSVDKGIYEALGATENGIIIGYAFFVKMENDYLLDYFAVVKGMRDKGYGSQMLQEISGFCQGKNSLICEVENPTYAKLEEERILQEKRKAFYMRNGFVDTGVEVRTFGVEYRILEMPLAKVHGKEEIKAFYEKHYKSCLSNVIFKLMIKIK